MSIAQPPSFLNRPIEDLGMLACKRKVIMSSFRNYSGGKENFEGDDDHKRSSENFNHGKSGK